MLTLSRSNSNVEVHTHSRKDVYGGGGVMVTAHQPSYSSSALSLVSTAMGDRLSG